MKCKICETYLAKISTSILSRCWQILLKIHDEMKYAPDILSTLQMGLLRLSFFSNSPDQDELLKILNNLKNPSEFHSNNVNNNNEY